MVDLSMMQASAALMHRPRAAKTAPVIRPKHPLPQSRTGGGSRPLLSARRPRPPYSGWAQSTLNVRSRPSASTRSGEGPNSVRGQAMVPLRGLSLCEQVACTWDRWWSIQRTEQSQHDSRAVQCVGSGRGRGESARWWRRPCVAVIRPRDPVAGQKAMPSHLHNKCGDVVGTGTSAEFNGPGQ